MRELKEFNGFYDHLPGMSRLIDDVLEVFREADRIQRPWLTLMFVTTRFSGPDKHREFKDEALWGAILALVDRGLLKPHPNNSVVKKRELLGFRLTSPLQELAEL